MFTIIHIENYRSTTSFTLKTDDLPESWYQDGPDADTSVLYNYICDQVPDNNWKDLVIDKIDYYPDYMEVFVTSFYRS